ncbi:MAG: RluA family pseudouridine synthase [Comamonadaceae bacterium]|nr:RluA family pseudouridine synthase [Comamonadaceae bacterium]
MISTPPTSFDFDSSEPADFEFERRELLLGPAHHNVRLDKVLADLVPEFSRSYLQQLIDSGNVFVNGKAAGKASLKVKLADRCQVELRPTAQSQSFKAETMPLDLVFQDEHLLVVNKPAGLVVHPAPGNWSGTLMNGLLGFDPQSFMLPRAGIVHRLDKDTSGLMVVARTREVMDALVRAIAARDVRRQYLALGHGNWVGDKHRQIDAPVGRDPKSRLRMAVVDLATQAGKSARTDMAFLAGCELGCLIQCNLHTGRTHQIRVHMASIGHPLVADQLYGGAFAVGMQRQALHAIQLSFVHPITLASLVFTAPVPPDLVAAFDSWGLKYN